MADDTTSEHGNVFADLVQDHARIEVRLKALLRATDALSRSESDTAALEVVAETLTFFATEGARHEEIEELTLFPRFRSLPEFKQILSALQFQHQMNRTADHELRACVEAFGPGSGRELQRLAFRFAEMHRGHAVAEERAFFPVALSVLSPDQLAELSREARERKHGAGSPEKAKR